MKISALNLRDYPLTLLVIAVIWFLSLWPTFPETELNDVPFIDKWVHTIMYGGLGITLWWEFWRCHSIPNYRNMLLKGVVGPIAMSGLLELIQEYGTNCRNGDWFDFLANSLGVVLSAMIGIFVFRYYVKNKKLRIRR